MLTEDEKKALEALKLKVFKGDLEAKTVLKNKLSYLIDREDEALIALDDIEVSTVALTYLTNLEASLTQYEKKTPKLSFWRSACGCFGGHGTEVVPDNSVNSQNSHSTSK